MRGFKIAHSRLGKELRNARVRVSRLFESVATFPSASKSENSTSGPWSSLPRNASI